MFGGAARQNPIKDLDEALDKAVMEAYGFSDKENAEKEKKGEKVQAPGLPEFVKMKKIM